MRDYADRGQIRRCNGARTEAGVVQHGHAMTHGTHEGSPSRYVRGWILCGSVSTLWITQAEPVLQALPKTPNAAPFIPCLQLHRHVEIYCQAMLSSTKQNRKKDILKTNYEPTSGSPLLPEALQRGIWDSKWVHVRLCHNTSCFTKACTPVLPVGQRPQLQGKRR